MLDCVQIPYKKVRNLSCHPDILKASQQCEAFLRYEVAHLIE
jgi:hypothetical protein